MKSARAIAFELRPSHALIATLGCVALLALLSVWNSGLRDYPGLAAGLSLVVVLVTARTASSLRQRGWLRASWNADGSWALLDASQTAVSAVLLGWSGLGLMLILRLRTMAGQAVIVYLLPDNMDRDLRRQLRVRLDQEALPTPR
ncbi:MAG: hypothetical protein JNN30_11575 [Rhodanobacteraceae bacterium]|nr:hypothetical protein [Rhodanobacteraceae bacterium]